MFIDTTSDIAARVTGAIREAARVTGAGFEYLLKTALRESNFDPNAKAATSSATGLFQFIDQTWLGTVKGAGTELGYGRYADAITKTPSGRYVVEDPAMYREIMKLRLDPKANAVMAGAFTNQNAAGLSEALGRKPTDGELYVAHFLGAAGATKLITGAVKNPSAPAADAFPEAARANRTIFYDRGAPRSFAKVYQLLVSRHDLGAPEVPKIVDANGAEPKLLSPAEAVAQAHAAAGFAPALKTGAIFHDLFRVEQRGALSPVVGDLWGAKRNPSVQLAAAVPPVEAAASPGHAPRRLGAPLDLFQFLRPEIRSRV